MPLIGRLPLSESDKEALREARRVEDGLGTRYISIPRYGGSEAYRDMEDFIATVEEDRLQEALWIAISGRYPFRRFKHALARSPTERERWCRFRDSCLRKQVLEWLESKGIQSVERPPSFGAKKVDKWWYTGPGRRSSARRWDWILGPCSGG